MNRKKLLTIQVLKQRVNQMQKNIEKLQTTVQPTTKNTFSKSYSRQQSPNAFRNTSTNKRYKSPTFWTGNTILGEQNPYIRDNSLSRSPKANRQNLHRSRSPVAQKIVQHVDLQFYQSVPNINTQSKQSLHQQTNNRATYFGRRYQCKQIQFSRPNPKIQKKKTYQTTHKDPILNPEMHKISQKKMIGKPHRSPANMYTENPNSDKNLYFNQTQPIRLSPKPHCNRNNSPNLKLLMCSSQEDLSSFSSTPKSNKKHYSRYYQDNLESKWRSNW